MDRVRVKICGINSPEAFDAAADAGADWVGFVFFPPSPRYVTPAQAAALSARRDGGPLRVGLFVEPADDAVAAALDLVRLDVLQLYASPERVRALRDRFGVPVWRAVGVASALDLPARLDGADGLVIEAKPPPGASRPGGNAKALDWSLTRQWDAPGFWLLAGGLTPANAEQAIRLSGTHAVDVSSGVEDSPGHKTSTLIRHFIDVATSGRRATDRELVEWRRLLSQWLPSADFEAAVSQMAHSYGSYAIDQPGLPFRDGWAASQCASYSGAAYVRLGADPPDFELRWLHGSLIQCEFVEVLRPNRRRGEELRDERRTPPPLRYKLSELPNDDYVSTEIALNELRNAIQIKAQKGYTTTTVLVVYWNVLTSDADLSEEGIKNVLRPFEENFSQIWVRLPSNKFLAFPGEIARE